MHPQRLDSPDDQRRFTTASIAAAVVFVLAWVVLGAPIPSLNGLHGWGPVLIAAGLSAATFVVALSLRPSDPNDPDHEDMGTV
ncbi:hypothetical protein SAMN05445756_0897 [Kytococcus aerolatus]|uniref:Uncharacterized protein n=1 Tax=Kytococcus aerolatus TaxID=592308 RepID=A0A212TBK3_9MICO|nr:hypothetical protein [Kytococcus aerolatus]SNC63392.1 hypothetical protein SAMN05445756_0897 [Kytococcus aerolatus]